MAPYPKAHGHNIWNSELAKIAAEKAAYEYTDFMQRTTAYEAGK